MGDMYESLIKWLGVFTWKKLLAVMAICALGLVCYERYTSSFRFSRLLKATELLLQTRQFADENLAASEQWNRSRDALLIQVAEAVEEKPITFAFIPSSLNISTDGIWKFVVGSAVWWLFAAYAVFRRWRRREHSELSGLFVLAMASGIVGSVIPAVVWPWFHLLIFPCLFLVAVSPALLLVGLLTTALRKSQGKADEIKCASNLKQLGLHTALWASEHGDQLPCTLESLRKVLPNDGCLCCPLDGVTEYSLFPGNATRHSPSSPYALCPNHNLVLCVDGSVLSGGVRWLTAQWDIAKVTAQKNTCINNLRMIDSALEQWALENRKNNGEIPKEEDIACYLQGGIPSCPLGGKYAVPAVGSQPSCRISGHVLTPARST